MQERTAYLPAPDLKAFIRDTFIARGATPEDTEVSSDVLLAADLRGIDAHGVNRLKYYHDRIKAGVTKPVVRFDVVKETSTTAVFEAHHSL